MANPSSGIPDIGKMSDQQLADAFGEVNESRKDLAKLEDIYKAAIKSRLGDEAGMLEGAKYRAEQTVADRVALDQARIKAEMGEDWVRQYSNVTQVQTLRVKRID